MNSYHGISISEYRLPLLYMISIFCFLVLLIATLVLLRELWRGRDKSSSKRIKKLKAKAKTDEVAAKQLTKEKRRLKKRRKKNRFDVVYCAFLLIGVIGIEAWVLIGEILPSMTDHVVKDYVVYTGEIKVYEQHMRTWIELADGTTLYGGAYLTEGDTYGTVVYAKRSKIVLGGQKIIESNQ